MLRPLALACVLLAVPAVTLAQTPNPPLPPGPGGPPQHDFGPDRGPGGGRGPHDGPRHEGPDGEGLHIPPGTWWRNPDVVTRVGLSPDQVKRIDSLFLDSRVQLIHMHASLEEEQLRLEPLLAENPVNQQAALAQVSKIADTRADLEKANAKMLLSIRGVLTGDQWTKLQQHPMGPDGPGSHASRQGQRGPGNRNAPPRPDTPPAGF